MPLLAHLALLLFLTALVAAGAALFDWLWHAPLTGCAVTATLLLAVLWSIPDA